LRPDRHFRNPRSHIGRLLAPDVLDALCARRIAQSRLGVALDVLGGLVFLVVDVLFDRVGGLEEIEDLVAVAFLFEAEVVAVLLLHNNLLPLQIQLLLTRL